MTNSATTSAPDRPTKTSPRSTRHVTLATIALSLLYTRPVIAAGGAVLVAAVMHGSTNSFSDTLTTTEHLTGNQPVVTPGGAASSDACSTG